MKLTLIRSELEKQELIGNSSSERVVIDSKRIHRLKFYADQPSLGTKNRLFQFIVEDEFKAIRLMVRFYKKDHLTNIRAAWLSPNDDDLSKKISVPFEFKNHPLFIELIRQI